MDKIIKIVLFLTVILSACTSDKKDHPLKKGGIETYAFGKVNQILVVSDSSLWTGPVGDTFFYYFAGPYILTPQPEAIFDITHFTPQAFSKRGSRKEFRMILLVADMNDPDEATARMIRNDLGEQKLEQIRRDKGCSVVVGKDKWAKNQTIFYVVGFGEDKLADCIASHFPVVAKRINEEDKEIIEATVYQADLNYDLKAEVLGQLGLELRVPGDFKKAKNNTQLDAIWLRRDVRDAHIGIIVHKRPYTSKKQLSKAGMKEIINELGTMISSWIVDSKMQVDDVNLPMFVETTSLDSKYAVVGRGIWEMDNDFKGGPFVCYEILDEKNGQLYVLYGYVFAPGEDKRNYLQEVEHIIRTAKIPELPKAVEAQDQ